MKHAKLIGLLGGIILILLAPHTAYAQTKPRLPVPADSRRNRRGRGDDSGAVFV
jgi:hypothetical protein